LTEKYGEQPESEEESTHEEEDEDAVLSSFMAAEFMEILPRLAAKDKSLKDPNVKFFEISDDDEDQNAEVEKPLYYKDLVRQEIVEKMNKNGADDLEEEDQILKVKNSELSIAQEEEKAKLDFLKAANIEEDSEDDNLLRKRKKKHGKRRKKKRMSINSF